MSSAVKGLASDFCGWLRRSAQNSANLPTSAHLRAPSSANGECHDFPSTSSIETEARGFWCWPSSTIDVNPTIGSGVAIGRRPNQAAAADAAGAGFSLAAARQSRGVRRRWPRCHHRARIRSCQRACHCLHRTSSSYQSMSRWSMCKLCGIGSRLNQRTCPYRAGTSTSCGIGWRSTADHQRRGGRGQRCETSYCVSCDLDPADGRRVRGPAGSSG